MPLSMRVSIECLPITCKVRDLENGRHDLNDGGPKMAHEKKWHDNLMSSYAQGDEGAEVAMQLLRRSCGKPSAAELGNAICSLLDVPLTLDRTLRNEERIQSFASVISAALLIRSGVDSINILRTLAWESLIVVVAASSLGDGNTLEEEDRKRLVLAVGRIQQLWDCCGFTGEWLADE